VALQVGDMVPLAPAAWKPNSVDRPAPILPL